MAIITEQPPAGSAVWRALHPKDFDRTREAQILELLSVLVQQGNILRGNQTGRRNPKLPEKFEDLFEPDPQQEPEQSVDEERILAEIAELNRIFAVE